MIIIKNPYKLMKPYTITIEDVKNVVEILYRNHHLGRNKPKNQLILISGVSKFVFDRIYNILISRKIIYTVGKTRNSKIIWKDGVVIPNETMFISIHNEYYKAIQKSKKTIEKASIDRSRITLQKCLQYLKDNNFEGRISKIKIEDGVKIETTYIL